MQIRLVGPGPEDEIHLEQDPEDYIIRIIVRMADFYRVPQNSLSLIKDDVLLDENETIEGSGIRNGDTLRLARTFLRGTVPPSEDLVNRARKVKRGENLDKQVRLTHKGLSALKTKQIVTETFLKFVPPSTFTTAMLFIGSIISGQQFSFLTAIYVIIVCMVISFELGYYFQVALTNKIYREEMYLDALFERRNEIAREEIARKESRSTSFGEIIPR